LSDNVVFKRNTDTVNIRSVIYQIGIRALKAFWHMNGARHITAFGYRYRFTPDTIFPTYRHLRLPEGKYKSRIVRYADFVQFHSVFRYIYEFKDSPNIMDIGAHHGAYAVVLGKVVKERGLGGGVIAIEPNPNSYNVLKENIRLNDLEHTVTSQQVAVLDTPGFASIEIEGSQNHITAKQSPFKVEVKTLTQLMTEYEIENVDLLIIDVEGAELRVLNGFPWESLKPGKIFCELHPYAWKDFGYDGNDLRIFLEEHRYRCIDMYLHEHESFDQTSYIGPCILVPA